MLKKIASDTQVIGAPERTGVRENGWGENLQEFIQSGHDEKKIEILKVHRTYFGSFFMEGYSLMVWRPVV